MTMDSPHAERRRGRAWVGWTALVAGFVLIGALSVRLWMYQAEGERQAIAERLAALRTTGRARLDEDWGEKARWLPTRDAPAALAILPRHPTRSFDAIYVLYGDDRVSATLALTTVEGFFNGETLDIRHHPQTLLPRPLTPAQLRDLAKMIELLDAEQAAVRRDRPLDVQSQRYTWTEHVLATLRTLLGGAD